MASKPSRSNNLGDTMKPSNDPAAQPPPAPDEHEVWLPISTAPKGRGAPMPLDPDLVERIKRLVGDIEVDLDAPLPDDQD